MVRVPTTATQVRVMPTATNDNATITVTVDEAETVARGDASDPIQLTAGKVTTITVVVIAQDGKTENTYTIAVSQARPAGIRVRIKVFLEGPLR